PCLSRTSRRGRTAAPVGDREQEGYRMHVMVWQTHFPGRTAWLALLALAALAWCDVPCARGQQQELPIYEGEPYDLLTLKPQYDSEPLKIFLLDNRDRGERVDPDPASEIRIRLLSHPEREFDVAWKDIERLEFFDELILKEGMRKVAEGDFDSA